MITLSDMPFSPEHLQEAAKRHLWMHFTRMGSYETQDVPVIVRGEGPWVWDSNGKRYLDGLSGLYVVMAGHGRRELAEAAARQASQLAYFPIWSYAHPTAIELAERLADLAPGDINRVFFTTGGSEAVESAWKLARQYFKAIGQPARTKAISRQISYHGTTMGALSITGYEAIKRPFEPLVPGTSTVPNTDFYRAPVHADDEAAFGLWAADQIAERIEAEGPRPWPRCSWNRYRTREGASRLHPVISSECARFAIATASCSCPMKSYVRLAALAIGSVPSVMATNPT